MKKNYKESIIILIGGIGVIPILMAIFFESLSFEYGIVIGFVFFLISGTLNGLFVVTNEDPGPIILQKSQKQAIVNFVGGVGVLVVLLGIFRQNIEFGYTIVIAYTFFLISSVFNALIETDEPKGRKGQFSQQSVKNHIKSEEQTPKISVKGYCSSCNAKIDTESIFCSQCGKDLSKGF